ncbi:hypothetical protein PAAG_12457 [Paracoccidioides lutzii Pb01]|uniref:Uncharacterized protein n=1 Tax=Paracoccidioides lutzii (strain ATCC MYA-826 / Pb01) TaxID=502779 RepID=A0A0A2VIX6_PARBA|nr:hypothetical protein PAAG_12457 [Paracoccidioides lutzii Pb01]KGQ00869.1 hypothetical protein PAAG_12457 [Paracoccidioides lutzii Pb01]
MAQHQPAHTKATNARGVKNRVIKSTEPSTITSGGGGRGGSYSDAGGVDPSW